MKEFDHFLLSRFNLRAAEWVKDKNHGTILTDEWLEHRLRLFEDYCLPSVAAQTDAKFTWLIYLSEDTAGHFRSRLEEMLGPYPWIKILYVKNQIEFLDRHRNDINGLRSPGKNYLITTRIDNDDVIHPAMIARIQQCFAAQEFLAVNFSELYRLTVEGRPRLYWDISLSNHFISVIEKVTDGKFTGCLSRRDKEWNEHGKILQITGGVYCVELIHSKNLINDLNGFPVSGRDKLKAFVVKMPLPRPTISFRDFFIWKMPWRKLLIFYVGKKSM